MKKISDFSESMCKKSVGEVPSINTPRPKIEHNKVIDRLRHLRKIEDLFKSNPNKEFTKTKIRDNFKVDYTSVLNALNYLLDQDVIKLKRGKIKRYILK